ncbi:glycosyltransferase [Nocardioides sp. C4-1]|uniref:glycosyltransferase n=1 Tax=Nocardioides sp. C4-1 TaxID=3151851 RepID=UPI003264B8D4
MLTPTYRPAGGVVKLMDYVQHVRALGLEASVWSPETASADSELFRIERFADLPAQVPMHSSPVLDIGPDDLALISLPDHYEVVLDSMPRGASLHRVLHLVQNVRHTNPQWRAGYPTRLLTRPATRIAINDIVADEIRPWLDPRADLHVVDLGHDTAYFARERPPGWDRARVVVGYTTWKSDVGDRVAERLRDDPRFIFHAIRGTASWAEVRDLYHRSDVFLSTPEPQEGLYLPGLEAMAAGCLVVTPDCGGNMAYCRPDDNVLLVPYDDVNGYVEALTTMAAFSDEEAQRMRAAGHAVVPRFDLTAERAGVADVLAHTWDRVRAAESP